MRNSTAILGLAITLACAVSGPVHAQNVATTESESQPAATTAPISELPPAPPTKGIQFTFTPAAWFPRVSGRSSLGPSSTREDVGNREDFELDDSEPTFTADFSARKHQQWQIKAGGFDFATDSHGVFDGHAVFGGLTLNPGDEFSASYDLVSFNIEATWLFTAVPEHNGSQLLIGATAGFRYIDIDQTVVQIGVGREDTGGEWVSPYLGVELELRWGCRDFLKFVNQVQIAGGVGFGPTLGGDGGSMTQIHADMTFMFTDNFGAFFGYKLMDIHAENDDYETNSGLEGLYFGATFRF